MLTRGELARLLRERGIHPKKFLGQNFLVDANFLDAIARDAGIDRDDGVVEIGSGLGHLTERLSAKAGHVWAFEIDPELYEISVELLGERENVTLVNLDGAEFADHIDPGVYRRLKIVSNLPYSDYQRILLRLLSTKHEIESYTLMLQKDVVRKLRAAPGTREYGPLAALVQAACRIGRLRDAGRRLFHPPPRVESTLFRLVRTGAVAPGEILALDSSLRKMFAHRRKKASRLRADLGDARIESLPPERLVAIAREFRR